MQQELIFRRVMWALVACVIFVALVEGNGLGGVL